MIRLGAVPYINALPFLVPLLAREDVEIILDFPSKLPALLSSGDVEAILVSSFFALTTPSVKSAKGVGIASTGPVDTVKLICAKRPESIQTLSPDPASLTSNTLAQIVLRDRYGSNPLVTPVGPADCRVVIGDAGMFPATKAGESVLDLGEEWNHLTDLPFVFALWVGRERFSTQTADIIRESIDQFKSNPQEVVEEAERRVAWPRGAAANYLRQMIEYRLDQNHILGLDEYRRRLSEHALANQTFEPDWV